jgi:hypothetical protein
MTFPVMPLRYRGAKKTSQMGSVARRGRPGG